MTTAMIQYDILPVDEQTQAFSFFFDRLAKWCEWCEHQYGGFTKRLAIALSKPRGAAMDYNLWKTEDGKVWRMRMGREVDELYEIRRGDHEFSEYLVKKFQIP